MTLHLIKLCVGIESVAHLQERQDARRKRERTSELRHRTRQMPRRRDELLDGGSLYWVIKGVVQVRQRLVDLRAVRDDEGVRRCDLVFDPALVPTRPQPRRAFQGWRYLEPADAPNDLDISASGLADMPDEMRAALTELGLI